MFPAEAFTRVWINAKRRELGGCDPAILEKCVHALTLLGHLAESGLPFLFKGGTSLLLHLPETRRLSRDIDIVCGEPAAAVDEIVRRIGSRTPFIRAEEDVRGTRGLPQRRHFKFFYRSALPPGIEQEVLLDVWRNAPRSTPSCKGPSAPDFSRLNARCWFACPPSKVSWATN